MGMSCSYSPRSTWRRERTGGERWKTHSKLTFGNCLSSAVTFSNVTEDRETVLDSLRKTRACNTAVLHYRLQSDQRFEERIIIWQLDFSKDMSATLSHGARSCRQCRFKSNSLLPILVRLRQDGKIILISWVHVNITTKSWLQIWKSEQWEMF